MTIHLSPETPEVWAVQNGYFTVRMHTLKQVPTFENIPSLFFIITRPEGGPVVVDTGFKGEDIPGVDSECVQTPEQTVPGALASIGISPEEIETVVLTHLHWDHTGGLAAFPNARFLVQADEMRGLFHMNPNEETYFCPHHWLGRLNDISPVDGTTELSPGITLKQTGFHSAGHQVVQVNTKADDLVLGGDAPFSYADFWKQVPEKYWAAYKKGPGKHKYWSPDVLRQIGMWMDDQGLSTEKPPEMNKPRLPVKTKEAWVIAHDPRIKTGLLAPQVFKA